MGDFNYPDNNQGLLYYIFPPPEVRVPVQEHLEGHSFPIPTWLLSGKGNTLVTVITSFKKDGDACWSAQIFGSHRAFGL